MPAGAKSTRRQSIEAEAPAPSIAAEADRLTPLKELQLVEACRSGGPRAKDALSELVRGYQRRIYTICLRMVRNPEDASDLTQDALIRMIEGLQGYNGQSKFSTWAIRIAMNCCLSHLRRQKIRAHESLESPSGSAGTEREIRGSGDRRAGFYSGSKPLSEGLTAGREPSPAARIEQEQTRAMVLDALESLDHNTRAILVLRDLQNLDYQQLADVLEVPIGTVKSRLFRARAALRQAIESRSGS